MMATPNVASSLPKDKRVERDDEEPLFVTTWKVQVGWLVIFLALVALFRIPVVQELMDAFLGFILTFLAPAVPSSASMATKGSETYEPLSVVCWVAHVPTMIFGNELFRVALHDPKSAVTRRLGLGFFLNFLQGWIIMVGHSLVNVHAPLEEKLILLGLVLAATSVFSMGIWGFFPDISAIYVYPLIFAAVLSENVTYKNLYGRIFSSMALVAVLYRPEIHLLLKLGYLMCAIMAVVLPLLPWPHGTNVHHTLDALYLSVATAVLMTGAICQAKGVTVRDVVLIVPGKKKAA